MILEYPHVVECMLVAHSDTNAPAVERICGVIRNHCNGEFNVIHPRDFLAHVDSKGTGSEHESVETVGLNGDLILEGREGICDRICS